MERRRRGNRWRIATTLGILVLAINVAGCGKISGLVPARSGDAADAADQTDQNVAGAAVAAPTPRATATAASKPGLNQPIAAHFGSIAETLDLSGRVAAAEEVSLAFNEKLSVKSVQVKAGQVAEAGQVLVTADDTDIRAQLDNAQQRLEADTAGLAQAQAAADAQQRAAARQAAAAQQAQADRVAAAEANLNTARANLQKVQAGPSQADLQAAQNAVATAQLAAHKADSAQAQVDGGPDAAQLHAAEQGLANAQAAFVSAQADAAAIPGALPDDAASSTPTPNPSPAAPPASSAQNITPSGVSTDPNNPPHNGGAMGIAVDPTHSGTVYVGTDRQGLWKTTDGGQNWAKINTGTNGKVLDSGALWLVALDPTDPKIIYAAPGYGVNGLWRSADGGVNWTPLFPADSSIVQQLGIAPTPTNLSFDPANHLHMIASSHFQWSGKYSSSNGVGVLETSDGGNTWTIHDPIPNSGAEHEVAMINSNTWLESFSGATYRTTDSGAHWTKVADTNGETQNLLAVNGALYLPTPSGIMRSSNDGAAWQMVGPGSMTVVTDGTNLYAQQSGPGGGHQDPIYYSPVTDGVNWSQYSSQSMCGSGGCDGPGWAATDTTNHTFYFANWVAGVWKLQTSAGAPASPAPVQTAARAIAAGASESDMIAARQRYQGAKDAVDAARAKLQALTGGPDQNAVDSAHQDASAAAAALQAAQAHLNELRRGPNPADLRTAQAAVTQAQASLDRARAVTDVQDDTAAAQSGEDMAIRRKAIDKDNSDLATLQARLAATQIAAPFVGTVVTVRVRVGDTADVNQPVITLAKPGAPIVRTTITPDDFDKVSEGQSATVQLPTQSNGDPSMTARVSSLAPNDAGTAKIATLEVDWPDAPPKLGTVLNVGLVLQQKTHVLLVPKKAVHTTGTRSFVELLDGKSRKVATVQVGIVSGSDAEILSGITEGQQVIVGP